MKTGGKIVVGLLAAGVVVGGAIALSHVFGTVTTTECGRLQMTSEALDRYLRKLVAMNDASPRSSALLMIGKAFHAAFPSCDFTKETNATFYGPAGEMEWQSIVSILGDKTVGEANNDPEVLAALAALTPTKEGSSGVVPDTSAGGSLKDIARMWMGAPNG